MSSASSPCAACKFLRRKCTQECVFAPYFPPDQPHKFASVHKVFGASNVAKILHDLDTTQREDAVNSLAYEADMRLRDPVYGCVGLISLLQHKLKQLQNDLYNARKELANYIGPQAMAFNSQAAGIRSGGGGANVGGHVVFCDTPQQQHSYYYHHHSNQHQILEAQRLAAVAAAAREHQEMLRATFQPQPQQQHGSVISFTQINGVGGDPLTPSLSLGTFENLNFHSNQQQLPVQLLGRHDQPAIEEKQLLLQTQTRSD